MKRYILFAGVNGSGKSTLYNLQNIKEDMPRINMDEIVSSLGDWRENSVQIRAGKIAVRTLREYLESGITFNQETTLCGKGILNNIRNAKERVRHRVKIGGHGIQEKDIEKRYKETFENLKIIMPECDLLALYDNTESFRRFAIFKKNEILRMSSNVPEWYRSYVQ